MYNFNIYDIILSSIYKTNLNAPFIYNKNELYDAEHLGALNTVPILLPSLIYLDKVYNQKVFYNIIVFGNIENINLIENKIYKNITIINFNQKDNSSIYDDTENNYINKNLKYLNNNSYFHKILYSTEIYSKNKISNFELLNSLFKFNNNNDNHNDNHNNEDNIDEIK